MECEYCHKILSSKSSLNHHQRTAKYCITLREKTDECHESYNCIECKKTFLRKSVFEKHQRKCRFTKEKESSVYIDELRGVIKEHQLQLNESKKELEECKHRCTEAESKNKVLMDEISFLRGITEKTSLRPTRTTNTINNNNLNLGVFDKTEDDIDRIFQEKYDKNYLVQGQRGVAQFTKQHIFEHAPNKPVVYLITDKSRYNAKYRNSSGEVVIDYGMQGLARRIHPCARKKTIQIVTENPEDYELLTDCSQEVIFMNIDNSKFCKEMTKGEVSVMDTTNEILDTL